MKKCTKCGVEKPLDEFYKDRGSKRADCKDCHNAASRAWNQKNRDESAPLSREWREQNKKRRAQQLRDWRRANPDAGAQHQQRRRARKRGNGVFAISPRDMRRLERGSCASCGAQDNLHIDHIVPIAKGGTHSIGNLQILCSTCNCSKGAKLWIEFRTSARRAAVA